MSFTTSPSNTILTNSTQNSQNTNQNNSFPHDIIVWNLNSFNDKLYELKILVKKYEPKVRCLQD